MAIPSRPTDREMATTEDDAREQVTPHLVGTDQENCALFDP